MYSVLILFRNFLVIIISLFIFFVFSINIINPFKIPHECDATSYLGGGEKKIKGKVYFVEICSYGTSSQDNIFKLRINIKDSDNKIIITRFDSLPAGAGSSYYSSYIKSNENGIYFFDSDGDEIFIKIPVRSKDLILSSINQFSFSYFYYHF